MRNRGFTLIETVLVLAIGILMIIGAVVFYMQSRFSAQVYETSRFLSVTALNVTEAGRKLGSYSTITTEYARDAGLIPPGHAAGEAFRHPLGGPFFIEPEMPVDNEEVPDPNAKESIVLYVLSLDRKGCERLFGRSSQGVTGVIQARAHEIRINGETYHPGLDDPNHGLCFEDYNNDVQIVLR